MNKYKVGDRVAVHYKIDKDPLGSFFEYSRHANYKKCSVIKAAKHWNYFFRTALLLSDGRWYLEDELKPIITCK